MASSSDQKKDFWPATHSELAAGSGPLSLLLELQAATAPMTPNITTPEKPSIDHGAPQSNPKFEKTLAEFRTVVRPRRRHRNAAFAALTFSLRTDTHYTMLRSPRLFVLGLLALACQSEPLDVADVDLSRMQGKWFEIASLPRPSQAGCVGTTAEYHLKSATELLVINECHEGSPQGPTKRVAARAVATDAAVPAKLSLDFGLAYGDYWITEVGSAYDYAVIGHPTRDYFWILSRDRTLPQKTLDGILARAKAQGFPVGILTYTEQ